MSPTTGADTLVRQCAEPGCRTLTLGQLCMSHEPGPEAQLPRGRPFTAAAPQLFRFPRKISA